MLHRDPEVLAIFNKRLDVTFIGADDSEGNKPFSDLQDAYAALFGTLAMQRHVANIIGYMGGYEAPRQIRSCEETAQYVYEESLDLHDEPKVWRMIAGDALQRVLIRGYDTSIDDWGARAIVPYPTLESFLNGAPRRNDYGKVSSVERIDEADVLNHPWNLGAALFHLAARFRASQHDRVAVETKSSDDATIHVFPPAGHPRLCTEYIDPVLHLRAKGYLAVAK